MDKGSLQFDAAHISRIEESEETCMVTVGFINKEVLYYHPFVGKWHCARVGGIINADEPSTETVLKCTDRSPKVTLHVISAILFVEEHPIEIEGSCLLTIQTINHADEPRQTVFIIDVDIAIVCRHITITIAVGVVVVTIVSSFSDRCIIDIIVPMGQRSIVSHHLSVMSWDNVFSRVVVERVEIPHEEFVCGIPRTISSRSSSKG